MGGSQSTFAKFEALRRTTNLTPARLSALGALYGIKGLSDASINRAIQKQDFNNDIEPSVRPLILRIEDLVERAKPFQMSFERIEHIRDLLDLIQGGVDLRAGEPLRVNEKNSSTQY